MDWIFMLVQHNTGDCNDFCLLYCSQEQATLKAKQRMLREDWELFKAQRKLIQQKMWNKTARYVLRSVILHANNVNTLI
jgi:hypothetical protein